MKRKRYYREDDQRPGTMLGIWLAIGVTIGILLGYAIHYLALGIAIGAAAGIALGLYHDSRSKNGNDEDAAIPYQKNRFFLILGVIVLISILFILGLLLFKS